MREFKNVVTITGVLVKNGIEEFTTKKGVEAIGGELVIRTKDGSEHEVNVYANKYKKDSDGNETGELSYFFNKYYEAKENLVSLETAPEEECSIVRISDGEFTTNDFVGKDGNMVSTNKISCKFINVVEKKDIETTLQEAKFEIEGVIESIADEVIKNVPTGELLVKLNHVTTTLRDSNGNTTFDKVKGKISPYSIVPITLKVNKEMASAFKGAGYYPNAFVKFAGSVINSTEIKEIVEAQSFGEDIHKEVKNYVRKYEIKSGNNAVMPSTLELTDEVITMLVNKRKEDLKAKISGASTSSDGQFGNTQAAIPPAPANPFANPFA